MSWLSKIRRAIVEQLPDGGVADRVPHRRAFLARLDDVLGPEHGELLGDGGLVEAERLLELVHAPLAPDEDLEDADADRVRERLEEFGLEGLELPTEWRLLHVLSCIY